LKSRGEEDGMNRISNGSEAKVDRGILAELKNQRGGQSLQCRRKGPGGGKKCK